MNEDTREGSDVDEVERELLLTMYQVLREEILTQIQAHNRRIFGGLTVLGTIIGYILVSGRMWLFALVPIVLALIVVISLTGTRYVSSLARHLIDIETVLSEEAPLFRWEQRFGGYYGKEPESLRQNSLARFFSEYSDLIFALIGYALSIYLALVFWPTRPDYLEPVGQLLLLLVYGITTLYGMGSVYISLIHYRAVKPVDE